MKKALFLAVIIAVAPAFAERTGGGGLGPRTRVVDDTGAAPGDGEEGASVGSRVGRSAPAGGRVASRVEGADIVRGARDGTSAGSRAGRSAPSGTPSRGTGTRGNGAIARGNRAATLGNVVGVHEGLRQVYRKYCGSLPAIAAAATKDSYCSEETFNVSEEEIFAPATSDDAPAHE